MPKQRDWWCRLYSEIVDDDKLTWVADATNQKRVAILGVWTGLLALANRSPERGTLLVAAGTPYTIPMLARKLDLDVAELDEILQAMGAIGLLAGEPLRIVSFHKRNPASDDATTRQQQHRQRGGVPSPPVVTPLSRDDDVTHDDVVTPASISTSTSDSSLLGEGESAREGGQGLEQRFAAIAGAYNALHLAFQPPTDAFVLAYLQEHPQANAYAAARCLILYGQNLGPGQRITPGDSETLLLWLEGGFTEEAIRNAIKRAARRKACNLAYVQAILEDRPPGGDGNGDNGSGTARMTAAQRAAFERRLHERATEETNGDN